MFQLVCFVRQMLSLFFSSLHPQERMTSGGRTELELHLTPSPTEDQPLPSSSLLSPSDCAQLLSLHPSIRLLYPPPDCTQRTRHLVSEGLRYRLALVLFWVWTILCMKMFSAENLKNKNLIFFFFIFFLQVSCRRRAVRPPHPPQHPSPRILSIPAWTSRG